MSMQFQVDEIMQKVLDREGKYLTFSLGGEEYGIGILKVREIIGMMKIVSLPQTPAFIKGVINLRDKVIPVIDLRLRFKMEMVEHSDRTCIIVVEISTNEGKILIGLIVDSVSEVLNLKANDIEDTPILSSEHHKGFILAMAKTEDGVKILLDIDKVLTAEELAVIRKAA